MELRNFGRIGDAIQVPNLIDLQRRIEEEFRGGQ